MTQPFPVVVWQDSQGAFTASVLDGARAAAVDVNVPAALLQLKRYLIWNFRQTGGMGSADFADLSLRDHRVRIRAEYNTGDYVYPVSPPLELRITCVHGKRGDGALHCVIPTLGIRLTYQPQDPIEDLVKEAVQQALGKLTPRDLSRHLMPGAFSLHAVHVPNQRQSIREKPEQYAALSSVAERLGQRGRAGRWPRALLRDKEVRQVAGHLKDERASLLLVGERGGGKSTVLVEAIRLLQRTNVKKPSEEQTEEEEKKSTALRNFWLTSGARIIAGMKYLGQWEQRCEQMIAELGEKGGLLCVEDLLELATVGGGKEGANVANFLHPYVERGELRLVAETTPAELDACRQLLPGLVDQFQVIHIPEFSPTDGRALLDELLRTGARHQKLELDEGLAGLVYRLFKRFQPYAAFPGRSAAFVRHLLDDSAKEQRTKLTQHHVLARFQRDTGLPEVLLRDDLPLPHEEVLTRFRGEVLGQEAACAAAAGVVTALKSGLNDPNRPLGVLLLCGPTGVGKTEMAKALSRFIFGAGNMKDRLVRLDMSEYAGYGAAQRLFQNADGQLSEFIQRIRRQPFVVVLFDEIEKAAPEVLDALLGVLDEGRLTDRFGRTTTFRSAVIVMTSNIGAERSAAVGFDSTVQPAFERIAMGTFRPEFYNRIDSVIAFQPLSRETIRSLARRELAAIAQREGLAKNDLRLEWSDSLVDHLAAAGYDARYGARPLHRAVEQLIIAPLAKWLLANPTARERIVHVDLAENNEIVVW
ncbi:AAA family ATPase [Anatilimnocola floriformis]|uniref:AAA family ATPase n=1 Tax=Anatilimnocola floriformis TaxID=2948575 RepID=UPI0020C53D77|nr:AAA family ATPase [Anatilimnocola floriformis]